MKPLDIKIKTVEEAEFISSLLAKPATIVPKLQEALILYHLKLSEKQVLDHGAFLSNDYTHGVLDLIAMNNDPYRYATHSFKFDEQLIFILATETCPQLMFKEGKWKPSYFSEDVLVEIENETHIWLDPKYLHDITVSRKTVNYYQNLLSTEGADKLNEVYEDLANSNSLGAIPALNAIKVVAKRNNITGI